MPQKVPVIQYQLKVPNRKQILFRQQKLEINIQVFPTETGSIIKHIRNSKCRKAVKLVVVFGVFSQTNWFFQKTVYGFDNQMEPNKLSRNPYKPDMSEERSLLDMCKGERMLARAKNYTLCKVVISYF